MTARGSIGSDHAGRWQFWIDRGGTFTDIVGRRPDGALVTHKLLSDNPRRYPDAAVQGIHDVLGDAADQVLRSGGVEVVKMGTTVATNALLERQGAATILVTTTGFGDALRIGYQSRPDLFALDITLPEMVYGRVLEIDERVGADGEILRRLDEAAARLGLLEARADGFDAVAIVLVHGYRHTDHEKRLAAIAAEVGFEQISVSHEVSPLIKLVPRGDTTVVDAYLSPILRRYVDEVSTRLGVDGDVSVPRLMFMQSNGGLTDARRFRGKDALLSGPAGGVVGMIRTGELAGFDRLIGFDMGGTSTDVSHYAGELERVEEAELAGVRFRAPMMAINTVAAGGGSILHFDGARQRVGPDSAGADPGPACYGNGGPLTITDCNVVLGRLRPEYFPAVFGPSGDRPLDLAATSAAFQTLTDEINAATGDRRTVEDVAEGFLAIAVENMANAIKKISVQRGHDVTTYTLACFGGAGGQHACLVADRLGIDRVMLHPHAGVLSALGIGLAAIRAVHEAPVGAVFGPATTEGVDTLVGSLGAAARADVRGQGIVDDHITIEARAMVRYAGSDTSLPVALDDPAGVVASFEAAHRARFGFASPETSLVIESVQVEAIGEPAAVELVHRPDVASHPGSDPARRHETVMAGRRHPTSFHQRSQLDPATPIDGPAVILEPTSTVVVEPGWRGEISPSGDLVLERVVPRPDRVEIGTTVDPVMLEVFNNLFMAVAEQMGVVLENTAVSVNIKERLDFSCAVFDPGGDLVANAPHMPVHLGSMGESIKSVIREHGPTMCPGDAFVTNAPYNGGTHLPDITVVMPVFDEAGAEVIFYLASRGHHADVGGSTPGSAPADSTSVVDEGVLLDNEPLLRDGRFLENELRERLGAPPYPARNADQNVADLKAQVAACTKGLIELGGIIDHFGLDVVHAYMRHVQDNAEESVRRVIDALTDSSFAAETDDGHRIEVTIRVDREARSAVVDFTGTSAEHPGNYNAPSAIAHAAVLYVFRCLVDADIPLNAGCLVPLELVLPTPSMISPEYPSAVFAGNVETSQLMVDTLLGALGAAAASQGTMNNVIWGNDRVQYYETVCGGAGATPQAPGCDAVHTHMTNSRLTDPEVLEWRFPVVLERFAIRHGSGGAGGHRGGDGTVRTIRFGEPMTVNVVSSRRVVAPFGLVGGGPGATGVNRVLRADGSIEELAGNDRTEVGPGDRFEVLTPGGGGWGPPPARGGYR